MKIGFVGAIAALAVSIGGASANEPLYSSVYTDIDLTQCTMIAIHELGNEWACPGHKGYPLWIAESDLRFFVSYGFGAPDESAASQTFARFNSVGKRLEWLLDAYAEHGDFPKGTILRYSIEPIEYGDPDDQVLVVSKIAPGNSCHVAYVDALANPDANQMARDAAHALIADFDCASDSVEIVGVWSID